MDVGEIVISFEKLKKEAIVKLENVKLRKLTTFDIEARELKTPKSILYYREPTIDEYPLDLAKGHQDMIFSSFDGAHHEKEKTLDYIMKQKKKPEFDFCTTRSALRYLRNEVRNTGDLVAIKFKNCIYMKIFTDANSDQVHETFPFKMRQHLFVDAPGKKPNTDVPVDQRKQIYATFSATLGKFKLLYSGEMNGVDNTEPLGDLDDPETLKQIRFSMVKIYKYKFDDCRTPFRIRDNIFQAHLVDIKQLRLANFNRYGIVDKPIETHSITQLLKFKDMEKGLQDRMQLLHNYLDKIKNIIADEDSPYISYVFHINKKLITYKRYVGPNKYSFLDAEYIDFINDMYTKTIPLSKI